MSAPATATAPERSPVLTCGIPRPETHLLALLERHHPLAADPHGRRETKRRSAALRAQVEETGGKDPARPRRDRAS